MSTTAAVPLSPLTETELGRRYEAAKDAAAHALMAVARLPLRDDGTLAEADVAFLLHAGSEAEALSVAWVAR